MKLPLEIEKQILSYINIKTCKVCNKKVNVLQLKKKWITNKNKFYFCSRECYDLI